MDATTCRGANPGHSSSPMLLQKVAETWHPADWQDVTVLIAVSGGADSVALARALGQLRIVGEGRLILAHFNHALRGAESDGDQDFVEGLGRELNLSVVVERGRVGERSEESLRGARYEFLARKADELGARYVATAHTADDQVETVLHNILRGTGLSGLAGIPRARPLTEACTLIRPLLAVPRSEVLAYLSSLGQTYRDDSSNRTASYTRNRIRLELLPHLEREYNPQVREALLRLSKIAAEADDWIEQEASDVFGYLSRRIDRGVEIDCAPLAAGPELLAKTVLMGLWRQQGWPLQNMTYEHWQQMLSFARAPDPTPQTFPGNIRAEKQGGVVRLTRPA